MAVDAAAAQTAIAGWHVAVTGQGDTALLPLQDVAIPAEGIRIAALLTAAGITPSNSEAKRKLKDRPVKVEGAGAEAARTRFISDELRGGLEDVINYVILVAPQSKKT